MLNFSVFLWKNNLMLHKLHLCKFRKLKVCVKQLLFMYQLSRFILSAPSWSVFFAFASFSSSTVESRHYISILMHFSTLCLFWCHASKVLSWPGNIHWLWVTCRWRPTCIWRLNCSLDFNWTALSDGWKIYMSDIYQYIYRIFIWHMYHAVIQ